MVCTVEIRDRQENLVATKDGLNLGHVLITRLELATQ